MPITKASPIEDIFGTDQPFVGDPRTLTRACHCVRNITIEGTSVKTVGDLLAFSVRFYRDRDGANIRGVFVQGDTIVSLSAGCGLKVVETIVDRMEKSGFPLKIEIERFRMRRK